MKIICPACRAVVPAGQINVSADLAVCGACSEAFSISEGLVQRERPDEFDIHRPPPRAWFEQGFSDWTLGATTRSPMAFFLVPFMCVWSGGSLGGIYGMQIVRGEFNLFMSLFGIPFLIGSVVLGSAAVMTVCGRVVVRVDRDEGTVFTGVGPVGWTRRFQWSALTTVEESFDVSRQSSYVIALVSDQIRLKFGAMLNEARRYYMLQALRKLLAERDALVAR